MVMTAKEPRVVVVVQGWAEPGSGRLGGQICVSWTAKRRSLQRAGEGSQGGGSQIGYRRSRGWRPFLYMPNTALAMNL